jgi:N utilization substance protein A
VTKALSPAKISRVTILDPNDKHMEVVVDDLQLSLAIGKRGQNVRLAAKLIGWKIDIKSEEEKRRELEARMGDMVISGAPVSVLMDFGMSEAIVEKLVGASIGTVEKLGSMTPEELEAIPGIDDEVVRQIQTTVVAFYAQYDETEGGDEASETEHASEEEAAPVTEEQIESVIDNETGSERSSEPFHNVETGVLEHDLARREAAETERSGNTVVLDLGRVEGLSGAPSALRGLSGSSPGENEGENA